MNTKRTERGQVLIFLVIGFIIILGFVGMAIDASMVYSDRRHAQNSADASSLSGGGAAALSMENSHLIYSQFVCSDPHASNDPDGRLTSAMSAAETSAIERAVSNGFTIDLGQDDLNYVQTECGVDTSGGFPDKYIDVTVHISTTTRTNFVQFLFDQGLESQVEAVTRVRPRMPLVFGHAVVALNKAACSGNKNGVLIGGDSTVHINGGGIFSNGCLDADGNSFNVNVDYGTISYVGSFGGVADLFSPPPQKMDDFMPESVIDIDVPNCSAAGAHIVSTIQVGGNQTLTLDPGLWCVTSSHQDAIKITGGTVTGIGVTIYVPNGGVSITGGNIKLVSPAYEPDPAPALPRVLFYITHGDIDMEGNNDSEYLGTIYVPEGTIKAHGSSGTHPTFNTQLIGLNVDVSGTADIDINYKDPFAHQIPTKMDLQE